MRLPFFTLITGSSQGFGKALAFECASRGRNLILVALPDSGLNAVARFIRKNYQVEVLTFEMDLCNQENCHVLYQQVTQRGLLVNTLINNAGILGGIYRFKDRPVELYQKQLQLNVETPTTLTYLFLDQLIENSPAHILNVGSLAAFFCLPSKQVYSATKSYLLSFSRSLSLELKLKKVFVTVVCPGGMNTTPLLCYQNTSGGFVSRFANMDPETVARIAIDNMLSKQEVVVPGLLNRVLIFLDRLIPGRVKQMLIASEMQNLKSGKVHRMIENFQIVNR